MAFKFITVLAALLAYARAGYINSAPFAYSAGPAYAAAPALAYKAAPAAYAAAPIAYKSFAAPAAYAAAPIAYKSYAAPAAYAAPAPIAYKSFAAPAIHAAPLAYKAYAAPAPALAYAAAPIAKAVVAKTIDDEYDPNPQYNYSYDVHDSITGDSKNQQETRNGDSVQGSYSLLEADGTRRIVEYTADAHNGFNAVVHKEPATVAVKAAVPVVAKAAIAAPAYASYSAPLAYKSHSYY